MEIKPIPKDKWEECPNPDCGNVGVYLEMDVFKLIEGRNLATCPCTNNPNSVYNQQQIKEVEDND